jgi:hypothetical protein
MRYHKFKLERHTDVTQDCYLRTRQAPTCHARHAGWQEHPDTLAQVCRDRQQQAIPLLRQPAPSPRGHDIRILLRETTSCPTHVRELVPDLPAYLGFCDACTRGTGGVWLSGSKNIHPIIWRLA